MMFRRWLVNLTGASVHWKCWDRLEAGCMVRSREVTRSRVLLECPLGWQWYSGNRVTRQSLGLPTFVVPGPLPPRVQGTNTYTRAELEQFTVLDTDLEGLLRRTMEYDAYKERYLARSLGVEQELQRWVTEIEARRAASRAGAEAGGEGNRGGRSQRVRGRDRGASFRGRGRGGTEATIRSEDTLGVSGIPELKWEISVRDQTGARAIVDIACLPRPDMNLPDSILREWAESAIMRMLGMRKLLRDCARGKTLQTRVAPEPATTSVVEPPQVYFGCMLLSHVCCFENLNHLKYVNAMQVQMQTRRATRAQSQAVVGSPAAKVAQAESRQFELRPRPVTQRQPESEESEESGDTEEPEESLGDSDTDSDSPALPDGDNDDEDDSVEEENLP
ncbi:uncharacterized protein LOC131303698 isoform X1 [Rhododendron vialii]|uniref:uncharacterized protein LOC131303698 isoform X1 n=1 Tax=Rhododendron vialii TaxID=182163 RepID=UPI00265F1A00|nr:uncharacterized protein LOC131303698 isoform X1 [Rhododendron vialii]